MSNIFKYKKHMNTKKLIGVGLLVLVTVVLIVTCPDKRRHQEVILGAVDEYVDESLSQATEGSGLLARGAAFFGSMIANKAAESFIESKLVVHNYLVLSRGTINIGGKEKTVSYGILNQVLTASKEDIQEAVKEAGNDMKDGMKQEISNIGKKIEQGISDIGEQIEDAIEESMNFSDSEE